MGFLWRVVVAAVSCLLCSLLVGRAEAGPLSQRTSVFELPPADDGDTIEVYYLMGMIEAFMHWEKIFGAMDVYHGAIGIRNINTGQNITLEYWPPDIFNAIVPIVHNPGPECTLEFDNTGVVSVEAGINKTLFFAGDTKLATLTGAQYNKFLKFSQEYNTTAADNRYYLFTMAEKTADVFNPFVRQQTCFDYVWDTMQYFVDELGVELLPKETMKSVYVLLYVHEMPKVVDDSDPQTRADICKFYGNFQFNGRTIWDVVKELFSFWPSNKYMAQWDKYYLLDPKLPFIEWHLIDTPTPTKGGHGRFP